MQHGLTSETCRCQPCQERVSLWSTELNGTTKLLTIYAMSFLCAFKSDILVGRRVGVAGDQPKPDSPTRGPTPLMKASCQIGA